MKIERSELTADAVLRSDPNDHASATAARTVYMALYLTANLSIKWCGFQYILRISNAVWIEAASLICYKSRTFAHALHHYSVLVSFSIQARHGTAVWVGSWGGVGSNIWDRSHLTFDFKNLLEKITNRAFTFFLSWIRHFPHVRPRDFTKAIIRDVKKPVATVIPQKGSPIKKSLWYLINAENCVLFPSPRNFRYPP